MADNLAYIVGRERGRGKVLVFAHNSHLQRGKAVLPWYTFWPAGSHLNEMFGPRYFVIGSAVGVSDPNGIGPPEAGTIEARLTALPEPAGDTSAQYDLAILLIRGEKLPRNYDRAIQLLTQSAKTGYSPAQYELGNILRFGYHGQHKDCVQAYAWMNLFAVTAPQGRWMATDARSELEKEMTPEQIAEAQRLSEQWKAMVEHMG